MNVDSSINLPMDQPSVSHHVRLDTEKLSALQTRFVGDESATLFFRTIGEFVKPKATVPLPSSHNVRLDFENLRSLQAQFAGDDSARGFFRMVDALEKNAN